MFLGRLATEEMLPAAAAQERPRTRVFPSHVGWATIEVNFVRKIFTSSLIDLHKREKSKTICLLTRPCHTFDAIFFKIGVACPVHV